MMNLLYSFICKDIKEFRRSKKIVLFALICMLYPSIINIIATRPLIPMQFLIVPASILTACFGGELLYFLTINEIKYRIFDIFLISKIGKLQLLLCKTVLPFLGSFLLAIMSLVINNAVVVLFPDYGFVAGVICFDTIVLLISSAIISSLIHFGVIIVIGKFNDYTHTFTIFISFLLLISLYITNLIFGAFAFFIIAIAVILLLVLLDSNLINLYRRTTLLREHNYLISMFPEKNISDISALLRKELIVSGLNFFTIIRLIISSTFPILISSFIIDNIELLQAVFRISLYFVCNFGVFNILFPVIKSEQINRYTDVFKVAKISRLKIYFSKCILPIFTMSTGLVMSFLFTWIYCNQTHNIFLFDYVAIITSVFSTFCSILATFMLSHYVNSYKDVRIIGFFITIITFVIHIVISFIPYWFF